MLKFSEYIYNISKGLIKTYDADKLILYAKNYLSSSGYIVDINYIKDINVVELIIYDIGKIDRSDIDIFFEYLNSIFINQFGWYPSKMKMKNFYGWHEENYDENRLKHIYKKMDIISIRYESKFDKEINVPNKLYHLSIQEYENNILKFGISPKSKSKLSTHLDRIYMCLSEQDCINLIPRMKLHYNSEKDDIIYTPSNKNKIYNKDTKWIIYEINTDGLDIVMYQDPNYKNGYYILRNIPPNNIKISSRE